MKKMTLVNFSVQSVMRNDLLLRRTSRFCNCGWSAMMMFCFSSLHAEPEDELRGEQVFTNNVTMETEKSFWDPTFWRNVTHPLEAPIVPTDTHWLDFGVKNPSGQSFTLPTDNLTLYTAARLGFTPPAVTPIFSRVEFDADEIIFNGTPDVVAPLGRMSLAAPHALHLKANAAIDFDRTILNANIVEVLNSMLTITGDVSTAGNSYNVRSQGNVYLSRSGSQTSPSFKLRSGAVADLQSLTYQFQLGPEPAASHSIVAIENDSHLQAASLVLNDARGKVIDASSGRGRATLGLVIASGSNSATDPAVIFHATGVNSPASAFSVNQATTLTGFSGILAQIEDGATMDFHTYISSLDGKMSLRANRDGIITMRDVVSSYSSFFGSAQLDWQATTNGRIALTQSMQVQLHLNAEAHVISASSGGKIDVPNSLGIDPGGRLLFSASGVGSELRLKPTNDFAPYQFSTLPAARWSHMNLDVAAGGLFRGGETTEHGFEGEYVADVRNISLQNTTARSNVSVMGASMKNVSLVFQDAAVTCDIGAVASPAVLNQVTLNLGDAALFSMRASAWQPERVEMTGISQSLQLGSMRGGSIGTITDVSTVHDVDFNIGPSGGVSIPGEPPLVALNSLLAINGGSTVTGSLGVAQYGGGSGTVNISGVTTKCGFRNVQLGVASSPAISTFPGPPGPMPVVFNGEFFSVPGGQSSLNLTSGARLAVGSYMGAFAQWKRSEVFSPAYFAANATPISIDATSAIYIGDVANAEAQDFCPGAMVVGSGGYLTGTGTILGSTVDGNDLINAGGFITPGFSPGTLTVDGNFLMESGTLVLEVESGASGGFDRIAANSITIQGGTIRIKRASGYDSGEGIVAEFFQTSNLIIGPSVVIEIAPDLGKSTWNAATGQITIVGGSENDLNENGIDDRMDAVLPAIGNQVEAPSIQYSSGAPAVFRFRRQDSSLFSHTIEVQWSYDLVEWNDLQVPISSFEEITITDNGADPDLIEVTLPTPVEPHRRIFARLAVKKQTLFAP
jgi:hypothetical protein